MFPYDKKTLTRDAHSAQNIPRHILFTGGTVQSHGTRDITLEGAEKNGSDPGLTGGFRSGVRFFQISQHPHWVFRRNCWRWRPLLFVGSAEGPQAVGTVQLSWSSDPAMERKDLREHIRVTITTDHIEQFETERIRRRVIARVIGEETARRRSKSFRL